MSTIEQTSTDVALAYLEKHPDRYLFPIGRNRVPCIKDNLAVASKEPAQIKRWTLQFPNCIWGLSLKKSKLIAVDIDGGKGKVGKQSYKALQANPDTKFTPTEIQESPSGGWHLVYSSEHHHFSASRIGQHINSPNYVVIAGCVRADGGRYKLLVDRPTADAPAWLEEAIRPRRDRPKREATGEPLALAKFKELLALTPHTGGPEGLDDRHSYQGWLQFAMACHEAAGGDEGDYLHAYIGWCLSDLGAHGPNWNPETIERHWCSFSSDPIEMQATVTRASWFKVLEHFGHHVTADIDADEGARLFADSPITAEDDAAIAAADEALKEAMAKSAEERTVIVVVGKLPQNTRKAMKILARHGKVVREKTTEIIFQRGGDLVHLTRNMLPPGKTMDEHGHVADDLLIKTVKEPWLTDLAAKRIKFVKVALGNDGPVLVPIDPPARLMKQILGVTTSWTFEKLEATVETPTIRADGSILQKPGYDPRTRLFLDPGGVPYPPVKERPTMGDARAATAVIRDLLIDFPFDDSDDKIGGLSESVALSAVLTAVCRRVLPIAPVFGINAHEVSSGKTELAQVLATIMTGRRTGERPFSNDEEEQRKVLLAALWAGDGVILFDNLSEGTDVSGGPLCAAVTERKMTGRILGESREATVSTRALILFTGNHMCAEGDMNDRILITKIVPKVDFGERSFTHGSPLTDYVVAHRPEIVTAALTIARAYVVAGYPMVTPTCRFPEWRRLCADPLVWLGLPDPCKAFERAKRDDPSVGHLSAVVKAWQRMPDCNQWHSTDELINFSITSHDADGASFEYPIREAIAKALDREEYVLKTNGAARWLKGKIGVRVGDYRIERVQDKDGVASWRISNEA